MRKPPVEIGGKRLEPPHHLGQQHPVAFDAELELRPGISTLTRCPAGNLRIEILVVDPDRFSVPGTERNRLRPRLGPVEVVRCLSSAILLAGGMTTKDQGEGDTGYTHCAS